MDNSLDTSFIPQQPLLKVEGSLRKKEPVNVGLVLAFIIFFVALATYGGMYLYKTSIEQRVLALGQELQTKEANLKTDYINRYKDIDVRLKLAKKLLNDHSAFSAILTLLGKITAQNIGWTSLSYALDPKDGLIHVNLTGQAPSYSAVYAQAEAWRAKGSAVVALDALKGVEVSMPALDPASSLVTFSAKLLIDPSYAKYTPVVIPTEMKSPDVTTATTPA